VAFFTSIDANIFYGIVEVEISVVLKNKEGTQKIVYPEESRNKNKSEKDILFTNQLE